MKHLFIIALSLYTFTSKTFAQPGSTALVNPYPKTISVSGSAAMEIIPDEIFVQVDLREYDKKGSGKIDLETIKARFLNTCKSVGIPDSLVSIAAYQGMDRLNWLYRSKKTPDLKASISYMIKFSNTKMIESLIEKLDDESTQNFFIAKLSHTKITEYRKQLKIQAIKAAKEKATYLAQAIGEWVGEAVSINEVPDADNVDRYSQVSNIVMNSRDNYNEKYKNNGGAIDFQKIKLRFEINTVFALR